MSVPFDLCQMESSSSMLYSILETAAQGDGLAQQEAMKKLQSFEGQPGYIEALCGILSVHATSREDIRLMAVISLKNVVGRYWSSGRGETSSNSRTTSYEEKVGLRAFLLQQMDEPNRKVFLQISALTAKVARAEWPDQWPELLPALFDEIVVEEPTNKSIHAMYVLDEVLQELKSKQLPGPRKALIAASLAAFPKLMHLWEHLSNSMTECMSVLVMTLRQSADTSVHVQVPFNVTQTAKSQSLLGTFCLCSAILLKIFDRGFPDLFRQHTAIVGSFFENLAQQLMQVVVFLREANSFMLNRTEEGHEAGDSSDYDDSSRYMPTYDLSQFTHEKDTPENLESLLSLILPSTRHVIRELVYIPESLQKNHPIWMSVFVESFLQFFYEQIVQEYTVGECISLNTFRISSVLFLSNTLSCREYDEEAISQNSGVKAKLLMASKLKGCSQVEDMSATLAVARNARNVFFQGENVIILLDMSLRYILPYGRAELEEWIDDPEQFWVSMEARQERDTARSAAEGLVLGLLDATSSSTHASAFILALLNDVSAQAAVSRVGATDADICFWDSVFLCAGLGASQIGQQIDATLWLRSVLGPFGLQLLSHVQAGSLQTGQQILRHRLLWLLRCWFYQFDSTCHSDLLDFAVSMLDPANESDIVVSMEACRLVETALDADVLSAELLAPMLVNLVDNLVKLANRLVDADPQATIVGVIGKLVQYTGLAIRPVVPMLMTQFATLWRQSESPSPLQPTILEVFAIMVNSGGEAADGLVTELCPLIAMACSGSDDSSFLINDGVLLWLALMRNLSVTAYTPLLDELLRHCFGGIFSTGNSEISGDTLRDLMLVCESYAILGGAHCLTSNAAVLLVTFQKLLCQVAPRSVQYVLRPLEAFFLTCPLEMSQFLSQGTLLLAPLQAIASVTDKYAVVFEESKEADVAIVGYLSLIARVMLVDPSVLVASVGDLLSKLSIDVRQQFDIDDVSFLRSVFVLMTVKFDICIYSGGCSGVWRQKLWVLALLALYPGNPAYLELFPVVFKYAKEVEKELEFDYKTEKIVREMFSANDEDFDHDTAYEAESDTDETFSGMQGGQGRTEGLGVPIAHNFLALLRRDVVQTDSVALISSQKYSALYP